MKVFFQIMFLFIILAFAIVLSEFVFLELLNNLICKVTPGMKNVYHVIFIILYLIGLITGITKIVDEEDRNEKEIKKYMSSNNLTREEAIEHIKQLGILARKRTMYTA